MAPSKNKIYSLASASASAQLLEHTKIRPTFADPGGPHHRITSNGCGCQGQNPNKTPHQTHQLPTKHIATPRGRSGAGSSPRNKHSRSKLCSGPNPVLLPLSTGPRCATPRSGPHLGFLRYLRDFRAVVFILFELRSRRRPRKLASRVEINTCRPLIWSN